MKKRICLPFIFLLGLFFSTVTAQVSPLQTFPIVYRGHIYLEGEAENNKGNFLFDTGADNLYYDSTFYAGHSFYYSRIAQARLPGAGESVQTVPVILDTVDFSFGNCRYRTSIVPVLQLKPVVGDFGDGIIGMDYFYPYVMGIDYQNEYITLYRSIDEIDLTSYSKLPLLHRDNRYYIPLTLQLNPDIRIEGDFLLDIGSGGSVTLTSHAAGMYKLPESIHPKVAFYTKYGGIGGESSSYTFIADSLYFGTYLFHKISMDFSVDKAGALSSDQYTGILGNQIVDHFDLLIDFRNHNLYVKPNETFGQPFGVSKMGFSFIDRSQTKNAWIVTGFYKGTPAEKSGLQIDDRIISVNGRNVAEIPYKEQGKFFKGLDELHLTVSRDGKNVEITFPLVSILETDTESRAE